MTDAQAAWLKKLKKRVALSPYGQRWRTNTACVERGWVMRAPDAIAWYSITPAGLAALAEHEEKAK